MSPMAAQEPLVVAGPNGSGKTTFAEEELDLRARPYLSADAIAAGLAPDDPTRERVAAGREFLRRIDPQLQGAESFVVESTLAGPGFLRVLEQAKTAASKSRSPSPQYLL